MKNFLAEVEKLNTRECKRYWRYLYFKHRSDRHEDELQEKDAKNLRENLKKNLKAHG